MSIKNHVTAIDWQRYKILFYIQKVCHPASCFVSSWYIIRYYLQCLPVQSYRRSSTTKQKWSVVNFAVYTIFYWSPNTRSTKMHEYYISQGMLGRKQLVRIHFKKRINFAYYTTMIITEPPSTTIYLPRLINPSKSKLARFSLF